MRAKIYTQEGKEAGNIVLPKNIFGLPWNAQLVHQVATSMRSNARPILAHTKGRSEVRGGGRKPWRQKGTGRARHGSRRSPIWRGGGITFGPTKERNFAKKINKKMKTKAFYTALSAKLRDKEILFVDKFTVDEMKTRRAQEILKSLSTIPGFESVLTKKRNSAYIYIPKVSEGVKRSFRNFGNVEVSPIRNMNLIDILNYKHVVVVDPKESVKLLEKNKE